MGCDPELVTGYVDGELSRATAAQTRRHLSTCRACSAQAKFEIDLGDLLRSLPDPLTHPWATREVSGATSAFSLQ
jgi:anti-sigma factor RsiW